MLGLPDGMTEEGLRARILDVAPELSGATFALRTAGWNFVAMDVDDRWIFRFPREPAYEATIRAEARILDLVRPAVTLRVPDLRLPEGPPPFSRHTKIPGEHLLAEHWPALSAMAKDRLADEMATFFAQLHALDRAAMEAAGAGPTWAWGSGDHVLRIVLPALPEAAHRFAREAVAAWEALPPDPYGEVFGYFDGHGWNMAFDHARERLNGLYDFGDAGIGTLHHEFLAPSWISRELTARIVDAYEARTGRVLDRARIDVLTARLRLGELVTHADDPALRPAMIRNVLDWARPG